MIGKNGTVSRLQKDRNFKFLPVVSEILLNKVPKFPRFLEIQCDITFKNLNGIPKQLFCIADQNLITFCS